MSQKVRSARGETVDFDLLKIKNQINASPKTVDVKQREKFIESKLRRRVRRAKAANNKVKPDDVPEAKVPAASAKRKIKKD